MFFFRGSFPPLPSITLKSVEMIKSEWGTRKNFKSMSLSILIISIICCPKTLNLSSIIVSNTLKKEIILNFSDFLRLIRNLKSSNFCWQQCFQALRAGSELASRVNLFPDFFLLISIIFRTSKQKRSSICLFEDPIC